MISLSKVLYATWPLLFFEMTIILIWMFFQRQDDGIVIINRCELCGSSEHVILIAPQMLPCSDSSQIKFAR